MHTWESDDTNASGELHRGIEMALDFLKISGTEFCETAKRFMRIQVLTFGFDC